MRASKKVKLQVVVSSEAGAAIYLENELAGGRSLGQLVSEAIMYRFGTGSPGQKEWQTVQRALAAAKLARIDEAIKTGTEREQQELEDKVKRLEELKKLLWPIGERYRAGKQTTATLRAFYEGFMENEGKYLRVSWPEFRELVG